MTRQPFDPDRIQTKKSGASTSEPRLLTVSHLTSMVKQAIEGKLPTTVHVVGEISNFNRHSSGHLYFTLKDRTSELSCVMWRSDTAKLKFDPADGLEVMVTGRVEVFERAGRYQLYTRKIEPRGVGALELAFRQLFEKLKKEGLFQEDQKKELPRYPQRIAIVTSPTGAVIADMLRTIESRYPCVDVLLFPVAVQGDGAAAQITSAIRCVNAHATKLGGVDVMIVGRGGGSLEDLWPFNEEIVARAIHASRIPVISAVGHEVDVTISDLAADARAATPTAAAQLVVPELSDLLERLGDIQRDMTRRVTDMIRLLTMKLSHLVQREPLRSPMAMVDRRTQLVDELTTRMDRNLAARSTRERRRLEQYARAIQRIAPHTAMREAASRLRQAEVRLRWDVVRKLDAMDRGITATQHRLDQASPRHQLPRLHERSRRLRERLVRTIAHRLALANRDLQRNHETMEAMSYKSVLGRGFSITRTGKRRRVVRSSKELKDHSRIVTEFADGEVESEVLNLIQLELFD